MIKKINALGGIGFLPIPGTMASLATTFAVGIFGPISFSFALVIVAACYGLVWRFSVMFPNEKDPSYVVLDEVAGQSVALIGMPYECLIFGFLIFRFLDITKPMIVGAAEKLPGCHGIMWDDLLAGALTCVTLAFYQVLRGYFVF